MVAALFALPAAIAHAQPGSADCTRAKGVLATALAKVVTFDSTDPGDVYTNVPGDGAPAVGDITPATLEQILADPDLGSGAAAEVKAALAAFTARDKACDEDTPPTTTPPTTTPAPDADLDCGDFPLDNGQSAQDVLDDNSSDPNNLDVDGNGKACDNGDDNKAVDVDISKQVRNYPRGGVSTGGGDLAQVIVE